ncbi:MAG: tyrosine-type recombinase/integrase [Planctomycetota bacterium]
MTPSGASIALRASPWPNLQLSLLCQGLYHQIKRRFGHEYVRVDRKNPFPDSVIAAAFSLPDGTICLSSHPGARFEVRWSDPTFVAFRAANALARYCGVRKDEVALADVSAFDLGRTSRANLLWRIRGVDVASPTAAQLRTLASDDMAIFVPATAKNDQFGFHFSSTPVWIKHTADPLDARDALAAYELCQPLSGPSRRYSPLFSVAPSQPLRHSTVDRLLQGLLTHVAGVDSVAQYSFHSHRITIASKLRKAGFDWPTIQALVRWRSVESALIYARLTPAGHASALATALSVDATSVTAEQLPTIDASEIAAALHAAQSLATAADKIPGDGGDGHAD